MGEEEWLLQGLSYITCPSPIVIPKGGLLGDWSAIQLQPWRPDSGSPSSADISHMCLISALGGRGPRFPVVFHHFLLLGPFGWQRLPFFSIKEGPFLPQVRNGL